MTELVMLDDGFGARLERRPAVADDRWSFDRHRDAPAPALVCHRCGGPALFIYRRIVAEAWCEMPFCTVLCAERAIRSGQMYLPGAP